MHMLAKELKSHRKKNMHAFLRTLKGEMVTPTKEEQNHNITVRGGIVLKEMDSFFDWRLEVRSSGKQRNRSLFEEPLSDYETTDNGRQSAHEPHVPAMTKMLKNKVHVSSPMRAKKKSQNFYDNFPLVTKFRRFQRTIMYHFWGALQI